MKRLFVLMALLVVASTVLAQESSSQTKFFKSAPQAPEMKKLVASFTGSWDTTITMYKGEWYPADGKTNGHALVSAGPAGNSLVEDFHSNSQLGDFAGRGLYWWSAETKSYQGIWCDSMDPRGCGPVGDGNWEGNNLVFNNVIEMGPTKMHIKETFSNISSDGYDFLIEAANGDGPMMKMMSIRYERRGAKAQMKKK